MASLFEWKIEKLFRGRSCFTPAREFDFLSNGLRWKLIVKYSKWSNSIVIELDLLDVASPINASFRVHLIGKTCNLTDGGTHVFTASEPKFRFSSFVSADHFLEKYLMEDNSCTIQVSVSTDIYCQPSTETSPPQEALPGVCNKAEVYFVKIGELMHNIQTIKGGLGDIATCEKVLAMWNALSESERLEVLRLDVEKVSTYSKMLKLKSIIEDLDSKLMEVKLEMGLLEKEMEKVFTNKANEGDGSSV